MLHLIENAFEKLLPAPLHRLALNIAHRIRHSWRKITKPHLSGVSVILHNETGQILLVRHSYGPKYWSVPGGGMDRGEEPEIAVRREMREELSVELDELVSLGSLEEIISGTTHTAYLFSARPRTEIVPDGREIAEARYFSLDAIPDDIGAIARARIENYRASQSSDNCAVSGARSS